MPKVWYTIHILEKGEGLQVIEHAMRFGKVQAEVTNLELSIGLAKDLANTLKDWISIEVKEHGAYAQPTTVHTIKR